MAATGGEAGFVGPVGPAAARSSPTRRCGRAATWSGRTSRTRICAGVVPGHGLPGASTPTSTWPSPATAARSAGRRLAVERVIEIGNIFKLGTKYSVPLGALYLDEQGQEQPIVMGSYGIGPARIAAAAIEQNHDADGIVWPWTIAPFQVHLLVVNVKDAKMAGMAERAVRRADGGRPGRPVRRPGRAGRREVQGRRPAWHPAPGDGREPGPEGRRGGGAPPADGRGEHCRPGGPPGPRPRPAGAVRVSPAGAGRSVLWRWGPLVVWMAAISIFSTDAFSAEETGGLLEPVLRWLIPTISRRRGGGGARRHPEGDARRRVRPAGACSGTGVWPGVRAAGSRARPWRPSVSACCTPGWMRRIRRSWRRGRPASSTWPGTVRAPCAASAGAACCGESGRVQENAQRLAGSARGAYRGFRARLGAVRFRTLWRSCSCWRWSRRIR